MAVGFDFFASLTQAKVRNPPKLKIDYPIDLGTEIRVGTEWPR
jgi:hypothetical protein